MKTINLLVALSIIAIILFPGNYLMAQGMTDPVSFEITEIPEQIQPGEIFQVVIKATIDGKWHLYSVHNDPTAGPYPTKFSSVNDNLEISGDITESKPIVAYDPNFDAELGWHTKEATFKIPVVFKEGKELNKAINLEVFYQVCDDKMCLPPKTKSVSQSIEVASGRNSTSVDSGAQIAEAPDKYKVGYWTAKAGLYKKLGKPEVAQALTEKVEWVKNAPQKDGENGSKAIPAVPMTGGS